MTNYQAGMMVRQSVIDFWPYLAQVINRINEAGNDLNFEALSDVFRDVGNVIGKVRHDVTVKELKKDFRRELRWYKSETKSIVKKRRQLQNPNPVGKYGKPLAASTLKQYGLAVKGWPKRRESLKKKILHNLDKLEAFSNQRAKIITRGGVSLKLLYGGRHAAKTWHLTKDKVRVKLGWRKTISKDLQREIIAEIKRIAPFKVWIGVKFLSTYFNVRPVELAAIYILKSTARGFRATTRRERKASWKLRLSKLEKKQACPLLTQKQELTGLMISWVTTENSRIMMMTPGHTA